MKKAKKRALIIIIVCLIILVGAIVADRILGKSYLKEIKYSEVIEKPTFPSLELGNKLSRLNPNEIHLCGLVSDICVFANAIIAKAACPNVEIYIHRNASESYDHAMQEKTYEVATHLHINIID